MPDSAGSPDSSETQELLLRAQKGDGEAREMLFAEYMPTLRGFVRLRLGRGLRSREESVDLVQSICGDLLGELDAFEYRGPFSFRRWLLHRAENKIRARARFWGRAKRSSTYETQEPDLESLRAAAHCLTPSKEASSQEELLRFEEVFESLSDSDRQVILLSRVAGLDHATVAVEMDRTPAATRTLLSRALARLATKLVTE